MPFEKSPPELVRRFDELAELVPEAARKPMFGYPSVVIDGHMFMGLFADHLVLRLGPDDRTQLIERGGEVFSPMAGRPMKDFVVVPEALVADAAAMAPWVERALGYARGLPPKKPPPKKPKAAKKAKAS